VKTPIAGETGKFPEVGVITDLTDLLKYFPEVGVITDLTDLLKYY